MSSFDHSQSDEALRVAAWVQTLSPALRMVVDLVQSAPIPMFLLVGPERRLIYNAAYVPILGQHHPAAAGQPFFEVWPEIRSSIGPVVQQAFDGQSSHFEDLPVVLHRPEPDTGWFTFSYSPVRDETSAVVAALCVCTETTETVRARRRQEFLIDLEASFRSFEDPQSIIDAAQSALGQHFGVSRVGYGGVDASERYFTTTRNWTDGTIPHFNGTHDLAAFGEEIFRSLREGVSLAVADTLLDPRAQDPTAAAAFAALQVRSAATVSLIKGGRFVAAMYLHHHQPRPWTADEIGLIEDVAERTWSALERAQAQERLRALNGTLEAQVAERSAERDRLWNLSQDMLARADYSGMMSSVSPAWTQVLGWSETELLSRGYATFMHPEDMPHTLQAIQRMSEARLPTRFENRIATADGGFKQIEWTVAPEPDGVNFVAVGRDMSVVRAREQALTQAQEQLRHSQKLEAMGQLTGGVAHDFNNLLTPIIGSLDMLMRRSVGSERERRMIDGALQSAERAKTLVQRLLAFARRQPLQPSAVDVGGLIEGLTDLITSTLGPAIEVRVDVANGLPPARADLNQLEMALLNLAVNARDAMPDGGELTIAANFELVGSADKSELRAGPYIGLRVTDTGVGMDPATLERAVEPFFSTKGVGKGTGLGLSMVHGLAAQLGGGLSIESAPGRGTTVKLWLPTSTDSSADQESAASRISSPIGRGTVLLVDDESLVRMSTAEMLIDLGFEVLEAGSAGEALRLLKTGRILDLLVTDHLMPGMSGVDLAREARGMRPGLPILVVSGYAEVEDIAPDLPRLSKPFRNTELAESLSALIPDAKSPPM